jgi:hypothetical protein
VRLTEKTREPHRWMWVYGEAHRALLCLPPVQEGERAALGFCRHTTWGSSLTHAPSEQTHLSSSRFTPRCPSVVLWTPCSGGEWRVFEPAIKRKRHDGQAACEPGGGGCGGVPVHPARLHTHRTSPAQALLTTLLDTFACIPNV